MLTAMRAWGLPVEPHWRRCDGHRRRRRVLRRSGPTNARPSTSTPTASSSRSTTWRCASGSARPRSFRGGRPPSSSPRSRRTRRCLRIDVNVGRTGAVTPYAVLEPVRAGRLHDLDGDAAQRRGRRAQGHPRGRHGRDREGRRRHPESRRARSSALRPPDAQPWVMPATCPECGSALHRDEEEVVWRCENASCPARLRREPRALRLALGDEHRGSRRVAHRSADRAGARATTSPTSITSRRRSSRTWS